MSRTRHHGDKAKERLFGLDNVRWSLNEPKYWRHLYKHKVRRACVKRCLHLVKCGIEGINWPQDKKPWRYYW